MLGTTVSIDFNSLISFPLCYGVGVRNFGKLGAGVGNFGKVGVRVGYFTSDSAALVMTLLIDTCTNNFQSFAICKVSCSVENRKQIEHASF